MLLCCIGTTVAQEPLTAEELLAKSEQIFVGNLIESQSRFEDGGRQIVTVHRFQIQDWVKGEGPPVIELTQFGGEVDGLRLTVSHTASYHPGGEYLVFGELDRRNRLRTVAGPLGRLPVVTDQDGNQRLRIYGDHPVRQLLGPHQQSAAFVALDLISELLREKQLNGHSRRIE